ncbi:MAG: hypothetical protein LBQ40_04625 [Clostridiales bacterium]|nr:hypothetical protein [Clostridiales bacterium]
MKSQKLHEFAEQRLSPSARTAWIEMRYGRGQFCCCRSPSARTAWIEMDWAVWWCDDETVAVREDGVD